MSNTKLFYSYKDTKNTGKIPLKALSSYSDSIIFDEDNRRIWHNGKQYGNTYWGTKHGETFNDLDNNYAYDFAHAEGKNSYAGGEASHVEGINNSAYGIGAHAEGDGNLALGNFSHTQGFSNRSEGRYSSSQGIENITYGEGSHTEGLDNVTYGDWCHAEGFETRAYSEGSHSEGYGTKANILYSHSEGYGTQTEGEASHAEGSHTITYGNWSHSEGSHAITYGDWSHSEGSYVITYGDCSHAEGDLTTAYGDYSHSEGGGPTAYGDYSHAEGKGTTTYGDYSHAEGSGTIAYGSASHAEGDYTRAYGFCSHTQGNSTIAYNDYESTFGEFNESITSGKNSTIFSIGDGTSEIKRHNIIDFRKNGDMHKNGNSYFHDNIYGPVSYTYVSSLGQTATLDIVLSSLLTQPEYTRPDIKVQYKLSTGSFIPETSGGYTEIVELGTYFFPEFKVIWPERFEDKENGTRAYDIVCDPSKPNYLLGYSYGVVPAVGSSKPGISISYNDGGGFESTIPTACNKTLYAYALDTPYRGATSPCYILGETTYTLFNNLQISYLPFSYMYFQQLYDKGVYVHAMGSSPQEWLSGGVTRLGSNSVIGQLKYFWGFSGDTMNPNNNHPKNRTDLRAQHSGWLPHSFNRNEISISTGEIGATNASKYCLWIAFPDSDDSISNAIITNKHYKLVANSDKFKIEVLMKDGMNFDLISPDQPLKSSYLNIYLANSKYTVRYKIVYIDFQKPIGNVNNVIKFSIAPKSNGKPALI